MRTRPSGGFFVGDVSVVGPLLAERRPKRSRYGLEFCLLSGPQQTRAAETAPRKATRQSVLKFLEHLEPQRQGIGWCFLASCGLGEAARLLSS